MEQNVIAIIWDFDKTLVDGYMQEPIFQKFGVDEKEFWDEVDALQEKYNRQGVRTNRDTIYLNHFITCTRQGIFKGLNNKMLREFGKNLVFYPGVPEIFIELKNIIKENEKFKNFDIRVEHYVVSTGLAEMIKGSMVSEYLDGIWGCEFIEKPVESKIKVEGIPDKKEFDQCFASGEISQVSYTIDNTSKTRALFEINKGSNKFNIDVNAKMRKGDRRVPFENMIYIADGPSDIPAFAVINLFGGKNYAIYPKGDKKGLKQVNRLIDDGRINMFGEADYRKGTTTTLWLSEQVETIAARIASEKKRRIHESASGVPKHLT